MFDIIRNKKGVALLMTIGILAIMSIIATSFALNMKLELEAAANYLRSVKALYLAEAGVNKVIADIRSQIALNSYSNIVSSYIPTYDTSEQSVDSPLTTYQVTIGAGSNFGEDQKVNLNALDDTDYVWITRLKNAGLSSDDIAKIIDYRDPDTDVTSQICTALGTWESCTGSETGTKNSPFSSVEEVRLIIGDTKYNNIKNDITIYSPIIRGGLLAEYYDSISGSSPSVQINKTSFVGKIIELGEICQWNWLGWTWNSMPGTDGLWRGWVEAHDAEWAGGYLLTSAGGYRMDTFGVIFEGYLEILPAEVGSPVTFYMRNDDGARLFIDGTNVISAWYDRDNNLSPETSGTYTFNYPGWHPIRLEYYGNTGVNGCCLKWSLAGHDDIDTAGTGNYIPAERFGFSPIITHPKEAGISYPSAGIYNITSIGKVKTTDGTVLAEKKVTAAVKIFGVWTQTTREDFYAAWFSDPGTATGSIDPVVGASGSSGYYFPGNDAYADGHVFNVTWLNSCPDNASSNLEAGGFTTTTNALKLGYWDDYDEDIAYSVVNLMAMARKVLEGPNREKKWGEIYGPGNDYWWQGYWNNYEPDNPLNPGYFALDFNHLDATNVGGNTTTKIKVDVDPWTELYFEVNYNYYRPVTNIFSRAWTYCSEYPSQRLGWRGNAANVILPDNPTEWAKVKYREAGDESHYYYDLDNDGHEWRDNNPKNDVWDTGRPGIPDEVPDPTPVYSAYNNPNASDPQNPQVASRVYIYTTYDPVTGWMSPGPPLEDNSWYSSSGAYWQPLASYEVPFLYPYGDRNDTYSGYAGRLDSSGSGHYTIVSDEDGWMFRDDGTIKTGDRLEITVLYGRTWARLVPPDSYGLTNVLAMLKGSGSAAYKAYWNNGALSVELTPTASPNTPNFKFKCNNAYELTWYRYRAIWIRGVPQYGESPDTVTHYWDNVRFIPDSGILASTPFYAGEDVTWGRLSFTEKNAADATLDVAIGLRTAASKAALPSTNTGWTSYANGAQITNTGRWLQYKATLTTTALDKDNYANSGKTPIFQDITITYLPQVEVLYYREVTE